MRGGKTNLVVRSPTTVETLRTRAQRALDDSFGEEIKDVHLDRGHELTRAYSEEFRAEKVTCSCGDTYTVTV